MLLWVDRWYVNFAVDGQVGEYPTRLVAYEFRAAACICASPRGRGRNYARNSDRSLVSFVSEVSWSINFREIVSLFFSFYSKFFNLVFLLPLFHEGMEKFLSDPARRRKFSIKFSMDLSISRRRIEGGGNKGRRCLFGRRWTGDCRCCSSRQWDGSRRARRGKLEGRGRPCTHRPSFTLSAVFWRYLSILGRRQR